MDKDLRSLIAASRPSVVLSQARASLLHPSRPSTPIQGTRRLFEMTNKQIPASRKPSVAGTVNASNTVANRFGNRVKHHQSHKRRESHDDHRMEDAAADKVEEKHQEAKLVVDEDEQKVAGLNDHTVRQVLENVGQAIAVKMRDVDYFKTSQMDEFYLEVDQLCSILEKQQALVSTQQRRDLEACRRDSLDSLLSLAMEKDLKADTQSILQLCRASIRLAMANKRSQERHESFEKICEMIYAVASETSYDDLFRTERLLEVMIQNLLQGGPYLTEGGDHLSKKNYLVYAIGSLKFISQENEANQKALTQNGIIKRLSELVEEFVGQADRETMAQDELETVQQILIQATAVLRCVVDDKRRLQHFWSAETINILCNCIDLYPENVELSFNCVRILSKLSMAPKGRAQISTRPLLDLLNLHYRKEFALCIRICFILGNLTTSNNHARLRLIRQHKDLELLGRVFQYHGTNYIESQQQSSSSKKRKGQNLVKREDLLIKLIRVLANIAIDEKLGPSVLKLQGIDNVIQILDCFDQDATEDSPESDWLRKEELALNAVALITNLTFYETEENQLILQTEEAVELLLPFLFSENVEAAVEAARAFGNFSRIRYMQDCMAHNRVDEAFMILLDHVDRQVVLCSLGVMTNLVSNTKTQQLVKRINGVDTLIRMLRRNGVSDPESSLRICMVLFNYFLSSSAHCELPGPTFDLLKRTLKELIETGQELTNDHANDEEEDEDDQDFALHISQFVQVSIKLNELLGT